MAGLFGKSANPPVSLAAARWLLVLQGIVLLPLFVQLPFWVFVSYIIVLAYMSAVLSGRISYPGKVIKTIFSIAVMSVLVISYWGKPAVEPMMIFLVLAFVLKMIEMKRRWDFMIVIYIAFIAVCVQLVYSQSMLAAAYALFSLFAILAVWGIEYAKGSSRKPKASMGFAAYPTQLPKLKQGAVIFLQAIPIMLVLFFVMPRVGALWALPMPGGGGTTGFSEEMSPGDVSDLAQSDEVAFRVAFDADTPKDFLTNANMYWRGLVLERFDGRAWKPRAQDAFQQYRRPKNSVPEDWHSEFSVNAANAISYNVILEPHNQKWLFALNTPLSFTADKKLTGFYSDYQLVDKLKTRARMRYEAASDPTALNDPSGRDRDALRRALMLPTGGNQRARDLARGWLEQNLSPPAIAQKFLDLVRSSYTYTLQPPPLGQNSIDEFLFSSKKGFCEHFSSAFVFTMRAANIPARVVVGYQGGDYIADEDYFVVRQSDAHAWAEIWLADQGWVRVDPTAAVAPERIESGLREALQDDDFELLSSQDRWSASNTGLDGWLAGMRLKMDVLAYRWHRSVLSYNSESQQGVLEKLLGGTQPWRILIALIGVGALSFFSLVLLRYVKSKRAEHPLQRSLHPLLSFARRKGYQHAAQHSITYLLNEVGALLLGREADNEMPAGRNGSEARSSQSARLKRDIRGLIAEYNAELYSRKTDYDRLHRLSKKAVKRLSRYRF